MLSTIKVCIYTYTVLYHTDKCSRPTVLTVPQLFLYNTILSRPPPLIDSIRVIVIVWRLRGNIIRTALCWIV